MNRRTETYLRWQFAKLEGNYIDLPGLLDITKDVLSRYWRNGKSNISVDKINELLDLNGAPKIKIEIMP